MLSKQIKGFKAAHGIVSRTPLRNAAMLSGVGTRGYFSVMDKIKQKLHTPMRHINSFMEPDGQNYESQLPDGYRLHGNTAMNMSAYITHNALEMNQWHEMEATVHS